MKELGKEPRSYTVGQRDAVHVPIVIARNSDYKVKLGPGDWVKFKDEKYTEIVPASKEDALGMIDPFLEEVSVYDPVVVLLIPGITTPVRHEFDIVPSMREYEDEILKIDLEERKEADPECAGCWAIRNREVIRY